MSFPRRRTGVRGLRRGARAPPCGRLERGGVDGGCRGNFRALASANGIDVSVEGARTMGAVRTDRSLRSHSRTRSTASGSCRTSPATCHFTGDRQRVRAQERLENSRDTPHPHPRSKSVRLFPLPLQAGGWPGVVVGKLFRAPDLSRATVPLKEHVCPPEFGTSPTRWSERASARASRPVSTCCPHRAGTLDNHIDAVCRCERKQFPHHHPRPSAGAAVRQRAADRTGQRHPLSKRHSF